MHLNFGSVKVRERNDQRYNPVIDIIEGKRHALAISEWSVFVNNSFFRNLTCVLFKLIRMKQFEPHHSPVLYF